MSLLHACVPSCILKPEMPTSSHVDTPEGISKLKQASLVILRDCSRPLSLQSPACRPASMIVLQRYRSPRHPRWHVLGPPLRGSWAQTILKLAKMKPWVIRGNASEIMALAGAAGTTRGVDSTAQSSEALEMGRQLARDLGTIIAISGKTDYVGDFAPLSSDPRPVFCASSKQMATRHQVHGCTQQML